MRKLRLYLPCLLAALSFSARAEAEEAPAPPSATESHATAKLTTGIIATSAGALLLTGAAIDDVLYTNGGGQAAADASYGSCRSSDHLSQDECTARSKGATKAHTVADERYIAAGALLAAGGVVLIVWGAHGRAADKAARSKETGGMLERSNLQVSFTPARVLTTLSLDF